MLSNKLFCWFECLFSTVWNRKCVLCCFINDVHRWIEHKSAIGCHRLRVSVLKLVLKTTKTSWVLSGTARVKKNLEQMQLINTNLRGNLLKNSCLKGNKSIDQSSQTVWHLEEKSIRKTKKSFPSFEFLHSFCETFQSKTLKLDSFLVSLCISPQ